MLNTLPTVMKSSWPILLLIVFSCLSVTVSAQRESLECSSIYSRFLSTYKTDPSSAYETAKEYLNRCSNDSVQAIYLKKWIAVYERITASKSSQQPTSTQERPSSNRILEQSDGQSSPTTPVLGRYYALVIGNNNYQYIPNLKTAEADAKDVEAALREGFGFETKLLLNATRQDIFSAISYYRRSLDQNDNLLIYYAGHGYFDRDADKAYWLPVDARRDDNANWIIADDITSNIRAMPAKHVLIISDSCYSGTIYRDSNLAVSEPIGRDRFLQKMLSGKSRTLMASGGNEPVADGGGGSHSIFARAFLIGLNQMEKDTFTATELFRDFIQERVAGAVNQTPEYNPLRNSGHESGDFVFIRKR